LHGFGLGLRLQLLFEQPFHALIELLHLGSLAQPGVTGHEAAVGALVQLIAWDLTKQWSPWQWIRG